MPPSKIKNAPESPVRIRPAHSRLREISFVSIAITAASSGVAIACVVIMFSPSPIKTGAMAETHRWPEKYFLLTGRQKERQLKPREKGLNVEKRVDSGDPIVRKVENDKRPGFVPTIGVHTVLAEGGGAAGRGRHQS